MNARPYRRALCALAFLATGPAGAVWINELHYDNSGGDLGEFVELAGAPGTPLDGWQLQAYNGSSGTPYDTRILAGVLGDPAGSGLGFYVVDWPGLQNGAPDGLALVDPAAFVVQFLGYEGGFTAIAGAAAGLSSVDIGVAESSSTPAGYSLQLAGPGNAYADFAWQAPAPATPGVVNAGQVFATATATVAAPGAALLPTGLVLLGLLRAGRRHGPRAYP